MISIKGKNPTSIEIIGSKYEGASDYTRISVSISNLRSHIYASVQEKALKIGYDIEKLLLIRKRKRIYNIFNSSFSKINIVIQSFLMLADYSLSLLYKNYKFNLLPWFFIITFWVIAFLISDINPDSNTKIELSRKHEINFYDNNKDKIILSLISMVFGALITLIIGYLKSK
ncbi:hypothetical protein [Hymenobacter lapidiphilus]|uniref:hypothetical protein n=1 Tax=Hymenobacter sp. CCM 8763 TaxID=2303334 RepID=UPI0011C1908A|nr:hypothetical protein [Hymenobacter sp. CCM 8763]